MNSQLYSFPDRAFSHVKKIFFLSTVIFLFSSGEIFSQGVTTGSMSGNVSAQKKNLIGATVTAIHDPTGTKYGAIVRSNGRYNIRGMRVGGPYTVKATFVGFRAQEKKDIYVTLGQDLEVNFSLIEESKTTAEVIVTGEKSTIMNANKSGSGSVVSEEEINAVPTINRSIADITRVNPLATQTQSAGSDGLQGITIAGQNSRYNNFQIDGAVANDIFGLGDAGTAGSQANANFVSLDAIQELQVNISPYDVRQSGFTGGLINAITRGGTNKFTGSVFMYGRNQDFVGVSPDANKTPYNRFSDYQFGGRIGGPIIENTLFFHLTAERRQRNNPLELGINDPKALNNFPYPIETIQRVQNIAREKYGYDAGSSNQFISRNNSTNIIARLDWNIAENHRLQFRHNFTDAFQDRNMRRDRQFFSLSSQWNEFQSVNNSSVLQLNSIFADNMANEFRLAYTQTNDARDLQAQPFPEVKIWVGSQDAIYLGPERNSQANSLDQSQWALTDNFTMFLGDHTITLGTHNEYNHFNNLYIRDYYGYYEFPTIEAFRDSTPSFYSNKYPNPAIANDGLPRADWRMLQTGWYIQDDWNVTENFRLSGGLRLDVPMFFDTPAENPLFKEKFAALAEKYSDLPDSLKQYNTAIPTGLSTSQLPETQLLWSPRLGFNWDVSGDRTLQLRGGSGVFTGRTAAVWLSNQYSNTGIDILHSEIGRTGSNGAVITDREFTLDPINPPQLSTNARAEINITDKNFKLPQVWRNTLGMDYQFLGGLTLTLEGIYSQQYNQVDIKNLNLRRNPTMPVSPVDGRAIYIFPDTLGVNAKEFTQVYYLNSRDEGYQYSLMAQLSLSPENNFLRGLNGTVAYTYSAAYDLTDMRSAVAHTNWRNTTAADPNNNSLGRSNFDVPHRILINLGYRFDIVEKFTTTIGLYYSGNSGRPFSYTSFGTDINNDGVTFNDLIYVPTEADFGTKVIMDPGSGDLRTRQQIERQFMDFINSNSSLAPYKGKIVERNSAREPWLNQLDLRILQAVPLANNQRLEFSFDVQNLLNLLNSAWGIQKYYEFGNFNLVEFRGFTPVNPNDGLPDGAMRLGFTHPESNQGLFIDPFYSRWRAQLGIRYTFN